MTCQASLTSASTNLYLDQIDLSLPIERGQKYFFLKNLPLPKQINTLLLKIFHENVLGWFPKPPLHVLLILHESHQHSH